MERLQLIHPEGKKAPTMEKIKYDSLRDAILISLDDRKKTSLDDLTDAVQEHFFKNNIAFHGKLGWNLFWVTLHLESTGEIHKDRSGSIINYSLNKPARQTRNVL